MYVRHGAMLCEGKHGFFVDHRLLMFGICVSIDERFNEAEEVFELAITTDSQNIIAWTVRGG